MRILVMGTGGVGGYYGAMLAHSGNDVTFIARGPHLEAMRERGLELRTQGKTIRIDPAKATASPAEAGGNFDLVLFTVKTYDTGSAIEALRPAVEPGPEGTPAILTLQNGIDSIDQLSAAFGLEHVVGGVTFVASAIVEPGVVQENGFSRQVVIGEPTGGISPRVEEIGRTFREAGIDVEVRDDGRQVVWEKFMLLAPHATASAATQLTVGEIFRVPEMVALYRVLIGEVMTVAQASGITIAPDTPDKIITMFQNAPAGQTSSMQRDFQNKRRVELEYLTGTVVRRAREFGIPTPSFDALYAVLKARALAFGGLS